jgi:hypothetical protein
MNLSCILKSALVLLAAAAVLGAFPALSAAESDEVAVFDGKDLKGWRDPVGQWQVAQSVKPAEADPKKFTVEDGQGIMINGKGGRTSNILSRFEHGDVEAHVEFCVPRGSNSGVYFMARYEIQVFDSWGVEKPTYSDCGGIYERWKDDKGYEGHAPRVNASKAPGEWQSFDVVFRAPRFDANGRKTENAKFVKVMHNGQVIHENVELTGPTRAATYEDTPEKPTGPLMLQGDHGPVAYRNIKLKRVKLD